MDRTISDRATLLITVAASSVGFTLGFNLGAFDAVFFDALLAMWVTATIVLVASAITDLPPKNWWGRLVLLMPTAWIITAWFSDSAGNDTASDVLHAVTLVTTLVCLPFLAWILVAAINPDFLHLPRGNRVAVFSAVVFFVLAGIAMGARNDAFLNCDDFKVSGNDLPANCTSGPTTPNPGQGASSG